MRTPPPAGTDPWTSGIAARSERLRVSKMDAETRRQLIEKYREGPSVLEAAIRAVPERDLDKAVEGWTPRQVAHHVADSEMTSAIRLRRLIAEDRPQISGY